MKTLNVIALLLVIIGGINWAAVGLFNVDVVAELFGGQTNPVSRVVYIIVGLAALYCLSLLRPVSSDNAVSGNSTRPTRTI